MAFENITSPVKIYNGNGGATEFPIPFYYADDTSTIVVVHIDADSVETTWVLDTDYTISNDTVVAGTAPEDSEQLCIYRSTPIKQALDLLNNTAHSIDSIESVIDKIVLIAQEIDEKLGRCLHVTRADAGDYSSPDVDMEMPDPDSNFYPGWDAQADEITNIDNAIAGYETLIVDGEVLQVDGENVATQQG